MNQHDQMREALRSFIEAMDLCGGYPDTSTDRERFDEAKRKAEQALATEPAPLVRLTDHQIEQGAKKLAELFDYPWDYMPEKGKGEMRGDVQSVFEAMIAKNGVTQ